MLWSTWAGLVQRAANRPFPAHAHSGHVCSRPCPAPSTCIQVASGGVCERWGMGMPGIKVAARQPVPVSGWTGVLGGRWAPTLCEGT